jgi:hypothetical protein
MDRVAPSTLSRREALGLMGGAPVDMSVGAQTGADAATANRRGSRVQLLVSQDLSAIASWLGAYNLLP